VTERSRRWLLAWRIFAIKLQAITHLHCCKCGKWKGISLRRLCLLCQYRNLKKGLQ